MPIPVTNLLPKNPPRPSHDATLLFITVDQGRLRSFLDATKSVDAKFLQVSFVLYAEQQTLEPPLRGSIRKRAVSSGSFLFIK